MLQETGTPFASIVEEQNGDYIIMYDNTFIIVSNDKSFKQRFTSLWERMLESPEDFKIFPPKSSIPQSVYSKIPEEELPELLYAFRGGIKKCSGILVPGGYDDLCINLANTSSSRGILQLFDIKSSITTVEFIPSFEADSANHKQSQTTSQLLPGTILQCGLSSDPYMINALNSLRSTLNTLMSLIKTSAPTETLVSSVNTCVDIANSPDLELLGLNYLVPWVRIQRFAFDQPDGILLGVLRSALPRIRGTYDYVSDVLEIDSTRPEMIGGRYQVISNT